MGLWRATFAVKDGKGEDRTTRIFLNDDASESAGEVVAFVQAYAVALDALIAGAIINIELHQNVPLPVGIKTVPNLAADVQEGAYWVWITQNGYIVRQRLPTFDEAMLVPGKEHVDMTAAEVQAFMQLTIEPIETPEEWAVYPVDGRGEDIVSLRSADEDFIPR